MCNANRDGMLSTAYKVLGFIGAVSVSASAVLAQPVESTLSDDFQQAIDEYLTQFVEEEGMPGLSVGIVVDDQMIYSRAFGVRSLESNQPVSDRTLFQICSITKAFTATLIALQVADGRLAWDDPIERYLPDWLEAPAWNGDSTVLTLRLLTNHRSGLPSRPPTLPAEQEDGLIRAFSHFQLWQSLKMTQLEREPDTAFGYSNYGYALAGFILEHTAGAPYSQLLRDQIFEPLDMPDSTVILMPKHVDLLAQPYRWDESSGSLVRTLTQDMDALAPSGDIFSSVHDLVPFLAFQMGAPLASDRIQLDRRFITSMREGHLTSPDSKLTYGLGWGVTELSTGSIVFHDGGSDGYTAYIGYSPDERVASIVLCNLGSSKAAVPIRRVGHSLLASAITDRRRTENAQETASDKEN